MLVTIPVVVHLHPHAYHPGDRSGMVFEWRGEVFTRDDPGKDPTIRVYDEDDRQSERYPGELYRVDYLPVDGEQGNEWFGAYRQEIQDLISNTKQIDLDEASKIIADFLYSGKQPSEYERSRMTVEFFSLLGDLTLAKKQRWDFGFTISEWKELHEEWLADEPERLKAILESLRRQRIKV